MLNFVHNPDVLTCIANLSSDEVFTPPSVVNNILDTLPESIWKDPNSTFLDPSTKSGAFLREITIRLINGLDEEIKDLEKRIDHILKNQVFGIATSSLTSLISKRTLYCSKKANGKYSIVNSKSEDLNILFREYQHDWLNGVNCRYCKVSKELYDRDERLESYAYPFIHEYINEDIIDDKERKKFFNMKFDVIIGNPPYQMKVGDEGSQSIPIYNLFIEQAMKLDPQHLVMIVPSRWFTGGRGLDKFRKKMLSDTRIKEIHDYPDANDCFPGVQIEGGVNFFLWEKDYEGDCTITTYDGDEVISKMKRPLTESNLDIFIRSNFAVDIINKVNSFNEAKFSDLVSNNDPFGFDIRQDGSWKRVKPKSSFEKSKNSVAFYTRGWKKDGIQYISKDEIRKNPDWIKKDKIFISRAYGSSKTIPYQVINTPFIPDKNSCAYETYLVVGPFDSRSETENVLAYMKTKFFRYLVSTIKSTQSSVKKVYSFVPVQDFSKAWTDEELYQKYKLSDSDISLIESQIRSME